jgi:hypothetical protein
MPQADGPELFRIQPDTAPAPPADAGIHSWPVGGFAPMAFYRRTPIVDFTRTVLVQFLLSFVLQALLAAAPGLFTVVACTGLALFLGRRAYVRWLGVASTVWKVATFAAMALNLLFVSFVSLASGCGAEGIASRLGQSAIERTIASEGCEPSIADLIVGYEELL